MRPQSVYVSATPGKWEMERTGGVFTEQVIRPTGLDRSAGGNPPGGNPGRRPDRRMPPDRQARLSRPGHHPDQEDGGRPDRIHARTGHPRALHAQRCGNAGAHRDHPRPAPGRLRRADRHQPAARRPGHSRMRAGRHPGRRQGRLPAQRDLAGPDHRPRRAQCGRQGDPVCRPHHRLDGARHGGDQPPPRQAGGLQHRTRHHAASVKRNIADIMGSMYETDHVTVDAGMLQAAEGGREFVGHNIKAIIADIEKRCAPPPPTWNSRKPPACATNSSGCNPPPWPSPTIPSPARADVARANLDAEITYSTDDSPSKPIPPRAGARGCSAPAGPMSPKTFGSRAR